MSARPIEELCLGRLPWDLVHPFPRQEADDASAADAVTAGVLQELPDDAAELSPAEVAGVLRASGLLRLRTPVSLGGHGLSYYGTFQVITAVAERCLPVALAASVHVGIGVGAYLPALPPGPLRDRVRDWVARDLISGSADTEPYGAANRARWTTATPTADGAHYLLSGEKIHIGNGSIADVLSVTATVREGDTGTLRLFFAETGGPGFEVRSGHAFMGIAGFPNAALRFRDLAVPADQVLGAETAQRLTPELTSAVMRGRLYLIAAPSLAVARSCAAWSGEFAGRRVIDGRPLGAYDEIRRQIAETRADVFAIEAISEWSLLPLDHGRAVDTTFEQGFAKNLTSVTAWRAVDRTLSLLGGEGYETAASKARRGAAAHPVERVFRDARNFRVSGGVDFQIDNWAAQMVVFPAWWARIGGGAADAPAPPAPEHCPELSARNNRHLRELADATAAFGKLCRTIAERYPGPAELFPHERLLIQVGRCAGELLLAVLVLARAAAYGEGAQDVADVWLTRSRIRRRTIDAEIDALLDGDEPRYAEAADPARARAAEEAS